MFTNKTVMKKLLSVTGLAAMTLVIGVQAEGAIVKMTIQNKTGQAANDLHITFDGDCVGAKIKVGNNSYPGEQGGSAHRVWPHSQGWSVPNGMKIPLEFEGKQVFPGHGEAKKISDSQWTKNGVGIGAASFLNAGVDLHVDSNGDMWARFSNFTSDILVFENILVNAGNDLGNYTLDGYHVLTGLPIAMTPETALAPDSITEYNLGPVGAGYHLISAEAYAIGSPSDRFEMAFATDVPEPASLALLLVGGLCGLQRRRL